MTAIGDGPTETWTTELRRSGQVVFPLRCGRQLRQTRATLVMLTMLAVVQLPDAVKAGGALRIVGIVVTTAVTIGLCVSGWQLLTRRPTLTIDACGIRLGRRRFMAWGEIGGVTLVDGSVDGDSFAVVPTVGRRKLRLDQRHVRNVPALRYWLIDLLEEHRRTAGSRT